MPVDIISNTKSERILNPVQSDYANIDLEHLQICLRCILRMFLEAVIWRETDAFTLFHARKCFISMGKCV